MKTKRIKHVARISKSELEKYWEIPVPIPWSDALYVQCTKEGKVTDWNKALVYQPEEITDQFKVIPLYECRECIHGCGQQFDAYKREFQKGQTVYTVYNRIPGILKCEVFSVELGKVGLEMKHNLTTEKDPAAEKDLVKYLENLLFTADAGNVYPDLETLFTRIQKEDLANV